MISTWRTTSRRRDRSAHQSGLRLGRRRASSPLILGSSPHGSGAIDAVSERAHTGRDERRSAAGRRADATAGCRPSAYARTADPAPMSGVRQRRRDDGPTTVRPASAPNAPPGPGRPGTRPQGATRAQRPTVVGRRDQVEEQAATEPDRAPAAGPPRNARPMTTTARVGGRARETGPRSRGLSTSGLTPMAAAARVRSLGAGRPGRVTVRSPSAACRGRRQDRVPRVAARWLDHDTDQVEARRSPRTARRPRSTSEPGRPRRCPPRSRSARQARTAARPPIRRSRSGRRQPTGLRSSTEARAPGSWPRPVGNPSSRVASSRAAHGRSGSITSRTVEVRRLAVSTRPTSPSPLSTVMSARPRRGASVDRHGPGEVLRGADRDDLRRDDVYPPDPGNLQQVVQLGARARASSVVARAACGVLQPRFSAPSRSMPLRSPRSRPGRSTRILDRAHHAAALRAVDLADTDPATSGRLRRRGHGERTSTVISVNGRSVDHDPRPSLRRAAADRVRRVSGRFTCRQRPAGRAR